MVGCVKKKRQNFTLHYNLLNEANKTTMIQKITVFAHLQHALTGSGAQSASNSMGIWSPLPGT